VVAEDPWPDLAVPLALLGLGALLHFAAKGHLARRRVLSVEGPYRLVRHPFYLGNILLENGLLLWAGAWYAVPVYMAVARFAYRATMREEEEDLAALHGGAWSAYAARVPAIVPWRLPAPPGGGPGFSLANLLYERELPRLVRLLSLPLGISWWSAYRALPGPWGDRPLFPEPADWSAPLLVGFISAQLLSWILAGLLHTRSRGGALKAAQRRMPPPAPS